MGKDFLRIGEAILGLVCTEIICHVWVQTETLRLIFSLQLLCAELIPGAGCTLIILKSWFSHFGMMVFICKFASSIIEYST